jgi:hypothetical protein
MFLCNLYFKNIKIHVKINFKINLFHTCIYFFYPRISTKCITLEIKLILFTSGGLNLK